MTSVDERNGDISPIDWFDPVDECCGDFLPSQITCSCEMALIDHRHSLRIAASIPSSEEALLHPDQIPLGTDEHAAKGFALNPLSLNPKPPIEAQTTSGSRMRK